MVKPRTDTYKLYYRTQSGSFKAVKKGNLRIILNAHDREPGRVQFYDGDGNFVVKWLNIDSRHMD